ncbi:MAG: hypothetical protein KatS3mg076_2734 [Candidatus Binatia bacterium]|nr:MAG: hypothetical protein KatS3mg076_2734 [Candidatus Binatia bacterium]
MRALAPWRPSPLSMLHSEIDNLFARFFEDDWWLRPFEGTLAPPIESFVRGEELVVRADLPGVDPKDVEIAIEGDRLTIRGERKSATNGSGEHLYKEVSYGRFERTITLPAGVDADSVKATYKDGVLEITMKAPKTLVSRKVPVEVA